MNLDKNTFTLGLRGHRAPIRHLRIDPINQVLISADDNGELYLRNLETRRSASFEDAGIINDLTVDISCSRLYLSHDDPGMISVFDTKTFDYITHIEAHNACIHSLACANKYHCLISGSADKTVKIWDTSLYTCKATCQKHETEVLQVGVNSANAVAISGSRDGLFCFWTLQGDLITTFQIDGGICCPKIDADRCRVFAGNEKGELSLWQLRQAFEEKSKPKTHKRSNSI